MHETISIIGAGSWGTALAIHLAGKFRHISLWVYEKDLCETLTHSGENKWFLPGHTLPVNIQPTSSLQTAITGQTLIMLVVPTHVIRQTLIQIKPFLEKDCLLICASKGIENDTLFTTHQIFQDVLHTNYSIASISGPTFAKEVASGVPSALVASAETQETASQVQELFSTDKMKVFTSTDLIGVELGGALKNVIAIATGICDGLGLGFNTRAALITRGLVEISRIGTKLGARPETFYGLTGLGDLVLTCTGDLSRNRQLGIELGKGKSLKEITENMKMVAEGVLTVKSAYSLIKKFNVQAAIMEETYRVLYENKSPGKALEDLMKVEISSEFAGIKGLQ
ncbi:MAG: NAD(P)-dependent glycerol-3-phosphate dehydrogenase [Nitrospina sp.]|jgi:glycerol-3-phosphate dehydrogenase (NAD(P)+)|nr:NAD(P)-dependent glycerol-3-phosphate dehydrogenase [Nitrospina sp.]MBT5633681.1 NAD(P)-dependent glycerol-3-phosphate dehydrogenase [Nitrospina sp.]